MQTHYAVIKLLYATDGWNNFNRHSNGNMLKKEEEFNRRRRPTLTPQICKSLQANYWVAKDILNATNYIIITWLRKHAIIVN
jgi:hypothetical protein